MTIHQAVSFNRMERAAELLRTTDLLVKEVAYSAGMLDQSHFVRDFKKFMVSVLPHTTFFIVGILPVSLFCAHSTKKNSRELWKPGYSGQLRR